MLRIRRSRALLLAAALLIAAAFVLQRAWFYDLPDPTQPLAQSAPSILITDRHGQPLYEVIDPNGSKQSPVALSAVPLACQQATIATEDSRFYEHPGVDLTAIARAVWQNWRAGETVSGGSTLTQQIARNLYLSKDERNEHSLRRKLREAWLAWRIERTYNKDEILALYLNTTYYGHFAVGIEAAAQAYFGVHAAELDLAQCALVAGLPQFPAGYNPVENPEAARGRQRVVLALMEREGYVSAAEAEQAGREEMAYAATPFPIEAPHFVMWVQGQLEVLLGADRLRAGGLRVTTTLDLDWQQQGEAIVRRRLAQLRPCTGGFAGLCDTDASPGRRVDDGALLALDPRSGAVRAMVGSPDYFNPAINGAVNATLSMRQPGSAIKPLTYATTFDPKRAAAAGQVPWTPATLIADLRTVFPTQEGQPYVPQNYDLRYHGPVTARTALANSYNIPAVKALQHVGVAALIEQAGLLGIAWQPAGATGGAEAKQGTAPGYGLALTLGGGEVRLLDLTAAYAAFANGGKRVYPFAIERVETLDGKLLWTEADYRLPAGPPALDPRVAYLVTDILRDEDARLPAFGPGNVLEIGRPAAAKTGTTTDWRDNWTVGYTPDVAVGVWVGNADNTPMLDISGISGAGPIWHDFMVTVLHDTPARDFERPDGLVRVDVCADSGLLPGAPATTASSVAGSPQILNCPNRRPEWFIVGAEPAQVDRMHQRWALDARTWTAATAATPPQFLAQQSYWALPPEYAAWARENGIQQPPVLESTAAGERGASGTPEVAQRLARTNQLTLTSPDDQRAYRIDPALPAESQQLPVTAQPGTALSAGHGQITLLVDGAPVAALAAPDYTAWWTLRPGEHRFEAVAKSPDGATRSAPVIITVE